MWLSSGCPPYLASCGSAKASAAPGLDLCSHDPALTPFPARAADVRGVFLRATGKSFCAGADLEWMKRASEFTREQNVADAVRLSTMLQNLNSLPQPTVALIQGAAFGGGVGLVSCCDIAVAVSSAKFALSEVKLGLIPATISPYVVSKIGAGNARRYFVTAERFDAPKAKEIGLVHEVVDTAEELEEWATTLKQHLMEAAPGAARASKTLVASVANVPITSELINETAERLGEQRMSKEGKEGLAAFFEKRRPAWASA